MRYQIRSCYSSFAPGMTKGLGLIQVLTALSLGLVMIVGATSLYVRGRNSERTIDSSIRLELNANLAFESLRSDIQSANLWGLNNDSASIVNRPVQSNATNPSADLIRNTAAAGCGSTFAVDVVRFLDATNDHYDLMDSCAGRYSPLKSGDTLTSRSAFNRADRVDATKLQLCGNRTHAEIILGGRCADQVFDISVNTYYVSGRSNASASYPSLRRKELSSNASLSTPAFKDVEVVAGVEDMQVQFGVDRYENTERVFQYIDPPQHQGELNEGVQTVRVWLLLRSQDEDIHYIDTRTYEYANRAARNGVASNLNSDDAAGRAYAPRDHHQRLLVSRTFLVRNAGGG